MSRSHFGFGLAGLTLLGSLFLAHPVRADTLIANFDVANPSAGLGTGPYGKVTVTDFVGGGGVTIDVTLPTASWLFVNTGNGSNHEAFAFNVIPAIDPSKILLTGSTAGNFKIDTTLPTSDSGFGSFSNGITVNAGTGGSNGTAGPLDLTITLAGLSVADFAKNTDGFFFAADVANPAGNTGPVGADRDSITVGVPEPSTWALMVLGFLGVGFAAYRRRAGAFWFA